ncbi:Oidioi.mRNA.OKI2018_I69.chr1.g1218.t1.cds [Oikopleura dioica]|uniref:Oidioi.mRNA.OKI2018_I69.chr1.g1218.t1.cds n=1 Tax=Oikopleura dioica TaxID=34765 RepID=A0ABN7STK9_OIKDI|nr:Oidioi.mRNA.OKI2018_I69.chr1.g1218.t1.cds [Oikopleura dioica]
MRQSPRSRSRSLRSLIDDHDAYHQCRVEADEKQKVCTDPCGDCHKNCNVAHHEDKLKCDQIQNHQEHQKCMKEANNAHHACNDKCHCIDSCEHRYVTEHNRCDAIDNDPALEQLCRDNAWELLDNCMKSNCGQPATTTSFPTTTQPTTTTTGEGSGDMWFEEEPLFL